MVDRETGPPKLLYIVLTLLATIVIALNRTGTMRHLLCMISKNLIMHDIEESCNDGQTWVSHNDFVQIGIAIRIRKSIALTAASPFH